MILNKYLLGGKMHRRMLSGAIGAFVGVVLYLLPSGNYTSESLMKGIFLSVQIFPAVLLALSMLAILLRVGGYLETSQILQILVLGVCIVLSFVLGALPFVGANGVLLCTIIVAITLFCSLMYQLNRFDKKHRIYGYILAAIMFGYDIVIFAAQHVGVS